MGGNERRMVRKPATKFGNLQKKLGKSQTSKPQRAKAGQDEAQVSTRVLRSNVVAGLD